MLIDANKYLWSKVPIFTFSITAGEQLIDGGIPVRVYRIEGEATIALYEDNEKNNLLYEGALPVEFETPISLDSIYVVSDIDAMLDVICETGIPKADLTPYLNNTTGMTTLVSGNDDTTYSVSWNEGFTFNNVAVSTIYVSSNNWYGLGSSSEHLKIMRRDGYSSSIRYLKGTLREDLSFLKIRYEGYTVYNSKTTANRLIYEVFFISNSDIFINLIQTPTSSNTGTSSITCGSNTTNLSLVDSTGAGGGKKVTLVADGENGTAYSVEYRPYQETNVDTEGYLLKLEDTYYTLVDGVLTALEGTELTPSLFLKYGFTEVPTGDLFGTLSNPHLYYWRSDTTRKRFVANLTAEPFPQVITATADLSHESIIGITEMTAQFGGEVLVQHSVDRGLTFTEGVSLADFLNTDIEALWESTQETKRIDFRFTLYAGASLTSFRIHYTN